MANAASTATDLSASARHARATVRRPGRAFSATRVSVLRLVDATEGDREGAPRGRVQCARRRALTRRRQDARVSVWLLDKRALTEDGRHSKEEVEQMLQLIRDDASRMLKLRHPGSPSAGAAARRDPNALALVTEPVLASAADILAKGANLAEKRRTRQVAGAGDGNRRARRRRRRRPNPRRVGGGGGGGGAAARGGDIDSDGDSDGDTSRPPRISRTSAYRFSTIKHGTLQLAEGLRFL